MLEAIKIQIEQEKRLNVIENKINEIAANAEEIKQITFDQPNVTVLQKSNRAKINEIVRNYCVKKNCKFNDAWKRLYAEFYSRYRVDISRRAKNAKVTGMDIAEKEGFCVDLYALAYEIFVKENY
jgi:hypothetical protein